MDMAQITVIGRLTGDPMLKNVTQEKQVTEFRVAVNHRYRTEQGWQEREPSYFNVECWDRLAENAAFTLKKGMPVVVIGRAEQSTWFKEHEDGTKEKRVMHRITAQSVSPDLGERTARVQFDRLRSEKLEEEAEKEKRRKEAQEALEREMNQDPASGVRDSSGTSVLRGSLGTASEGDREKNLVGVTAGFVPQGEDAEVPDEFLED